MPKALSIDRAVDKHLKPVKDSDGTLTALELSTDTVRVKNLVVAGKVEGSLEVDTITTRGDFALDVAGDIIADVAGGQFTIQDNTTGDPDLIIKCTSTDVVGDSGGSLVFEKNKDGTGADAEDGDVLGTIKFEGYNDAGTPFLTSFGQITCESTDVTEDSESGSLKLKVITKDALFGAAIETGLLLIGSDTNDEVDVTIGNGSASLTTIAGDLDIDGDTITTAGAISLDSGGAITLDAAHGSFIAKNAGTEFSAANSAYAGMILGYTVIGDNATPASFDVTNAMLPVHDDLKVSFVFPPSGKVEIFASIYVQTDNSRPLTFGLSTTDASTGFASLGAKYENHTIQPDETDGIQHTHRWYVTGTAGDSEELWFSAGCTATNRYDLFWGGDSSSVADSSHPMEYQPFVMKATALPATIYTG